MAAEKKAPLWWFKWKGWPSQWWSRWDALRTLVNDSVMQPRSGSTNSDLSRAQRHRGHARHRAPDRADDSRRRKGFCGPAESDPDLSQVLRAAEGSLGRSLCAVLLGPQQHSLHPGHLSCGVAAHTASDVGVASRRLRRHDDSTRGHVAFDGTPRAASVDWVPREQTAQLHPYLSRGECPRTLDPSGRNDEQAHGVGTARGMEKHSRSVINAEFFS